MEKYILNTSYREEFSLNWEEGDTLPSNSIVHVPLDHIVSFFNLIKETNKKYIVVSSNSDYCLTEQTKEPVERDMNKFFAMIDTTGQGYNTLVVPARCDVSECRISDKYSIKMYSFTKRTFNKIPKNVTKWFCTNANIQDERIVNIPFGIPSWSKNLVGKQRKEKFGIYINFQNNTQERLAIKKLFAELPNVLIEDGVSHEQYISRLKEYPFIISPPGNGYDCYRTLESIYCGSIPIIVNDVWSKAYDNIPCIKVSSYFGIYEQLQNLWQEIQGVDDFFAGIEQKFLLHWTDKIKQSESLL